MTKSTQRVIFWTVVALIIALSVFIIIQGQRQSGGNGEIPTISTEDWTQGTPESTVELIEYSDFQCPACAGAHLAVNQIIAEFKNRINLAYRYFPLDSIHDKARLSAQAAEAAGNQGKFWEMSDQLFENQKNWENLSLHDAENMFISYAIELGLDVKKFTEDMNSSKIIKKIDDSYNEAVEAGLGGTPTFFLNGEQIHPKNLEDFRSLIREKIE